MSEASSESKLEVAVLIIGTCHQYQRHQDVDPERERIRRDFEDLVRAQIAERCIGLIAEEAGRKGDVQAQLKDDAAKSPCFDVLFPELNEPQDTIAKILADELLKGSYIDIRSPNADNMTIAQRDAEMAIKK